MAALKTLRSRRTDGAQQASCGDHIQKAISQMEKGEAYRMPFAPRSPSRDLLDKDALDDGNAYGSVTERLQTDG